MKEKASIDDIKKQLVIAPQSWEELFIIAVKRAKRRSTRKIRRIEDFKLLRIRKIKETGLYLSRNLEEIALKSPFLRDLHPFYSELLELTINSDEYKLCMSRILSVSRIIKKIMKEILREMRYVRDKKEVLALERRFFGRVYSLLRDLDYCFRRVRYYQKEFLKLPSINPYIPSVIIAGAPNVGKSSLLRRLSKAKPEVQPYPFTTKNIVVGHMIYDGEKVQVIDTPGLLDRPLENKGKIELHAILAIKFLGNAIIYVFDPTETCGFPLEYQLNIYKDLCKFFPKVKKIIIANKLDILDTARLNKFLRLIPENKYVIFVSALHGINIDYLKGTLISYLEVSNR